MEKAPTFLITERLPSLHLSTEQNGRELTDLTFTGNTRWLRWRLESHYCKAFAPGLEF